MCRNIKQLYNFEPHATKNEINAAALQYVKKVSGFQKPSAVNDAAFNRAVEEIAHVTDHLLQNLVTHSSAKDRETEAEKARVRSAKRFNKDLIK